jgi:hypothetical protein
VECKNASAAAGVAVDRDDIAPRRIAARARRRVLGCFALCPVLAEPSILTSPQHLLVRNLLFCKQTLLKRLPGVQ